MTDNISRLTGQRITNGLQGNSIISSRLRQLSGTGSRLARTSRGTIDDISSSSGITRRIYSDSNRRPSVARYSTSTRRYLSKTRRGVNRGRLSYTNAFDTDRNGTVSDRESMNYLIKLRKNNSERGLAELMQFNQKTQQINQHLNEIDVNRDGVISNQETMNTILNKRANQVASTDLDIVNMILENNSRSTELENLVARVDTDPDGQISREEVLAVLTDIRNNNLDPALVDQLTEVLELNSDIDSIIEEFENSIGANYVASQHAEAQVLTVRRGQELQMLGANHSDLMPSPLGFLEELAEIYGDEYLSDDENSSDFYRFGGLTGQIQEALIDSGHTLEDLINGQINQDDMNLIMDTITQYHPNQTDDIEASFAEQHQSVVNYIGQVQHDLADPRVDFALSMPQLFDAIAEHYGDIGFFDDGYAGFTGALQNALQDWGSLDATTMLNGDFLTQISTILQALPDVEEPSQPLSIEERLAQFADINGSGVVDMNDALRLASMIHNPFMNAREAGNGFIDIITRDEMFGAPEPGPEATNFNNGVYDFNGDGTTGPEDLRLLIKYINGARGDELYEETGATVQNYIENILSPDTEIGFGTGLWTVGGNSYQGVFGSKITQEDITHLTNIVQGNPDLNYPDGAIPIHGDHIAMAVGAGLLDVNNDGVTDMEDVAILQRYLDGARGDGLLDQNIAATEARLANLTDINMDGALRLAYQITHPDADYTIGSKGYEQSFEGQFAAGAYDFSGDGQTSVEDLRLLVKYIDGIRGEDLYQETGDTIQSYIDNILNPDHSISLNLMGTRSYDGVYGLFRYQDSLDYFARLLTDENVPNYSSRQTHIKEAFNAGLLDINNDGVTDIQDLNIVRRYQEGFRGNELIDPDARMVSMNHLTTSIAEQMDQIKASADLTFEEKLTAQLDILTSNQKIFAFLPNDANISKSLLLGYALGYRGEDLLVNSFSEEQLDEVRALLDDEPNIELVLGQLFDSGILDFDNDGEVDINDMRFFLVSNPRGGQSQFADLLRRYDGRGSFYNDEEYYVSNADFYTGRIGQAYHEYIVPYLSGDHSEIPEQDLEILTRLVTGTSFVDSNEDGIVSVQEVSNIRGLYGRYDKEGVIELASSMGLYDIVNGSNLSPEQINNANAILIARYIAGQTDAEQLLRGFDPSLLDYDQIITRLETAKSSGAFDLITGPSTDSVLDGAVDSYSIFRFVRNGTHSSGNVDQAIDLLKAVFGDENGSLNLGSDQDIGDLSGAYGVYFVTNQQIRGHELGYRGDELLTWDAEQTALSVVIDNLESMMSEGHGLGSNYGHLDSRFRNVNRILNDIFVTNGNPFLSHNYRESFVDSIQEMRLEWYNEVVAPGIQNRYSAGVDDPELLTLAEFQDFLNRLQVLVE